MIKDRKNCFCLKMYPVLSLIIERAIETAYIKIYFHVINIIKCLLELQGILNDGSVNKIQRSVPKG